MDYPRDVSPPANSQELSIGQCATQACLWEATAPKPGNVHPQASFPDTCYDDYVLSAQAIGPAMEAAVREGVGTTVWQAVEATRSVVSSNTNLGLILLLAPLASVPREEPLPSGVKDILKELTAADTERVYTAIERVQPGGIGSVDSLDIHQLPPENLVNAMKQARDRDLIARQYSDGFVDLFDLVYPWLQQGMATGWTLSDSIVRCHIACMASFPDSLIARKCGLSVAQESQRRAQAVLDQGSPTSPGYQQGIDELDHWLRADDQRRNPGTTADMVGAALFIGLRHGTIDGSLSIP